MKRSRGRLLRCAAERATVPSGDVPSRRTAGCGSSTGTASKQQRAGAADHERRVDAAVIINQPRTLERIEPMPTPAVA